MPPSQEFGANRHHPRSLLVAVIVGLTVFSAGITLVLWFKWRQDSVAEEAAMRKKKDPEDERLARLARYTGDVPPGQTEWQRHSDPVPWKMQKLGGEAPGISAFAFSPDSQQLVVLTHNRNDYASGDLEVWDVRQAKLLRRIKPPKVSNKAHICFSPVTKHFLVLDKAVNSSGNALLYRADDLTLVWKLRGGEDADFSPNGKLLAIGEMGQIRCFNTLVGNEAGIELVVDVTSIGLCRGLRFASNEDVVVQHNDDFNFLAMKGGKTAVWNLRSRTTPRVLSGFRQSGMTQIAMSADYSLVYHRPGWSLSYEGPIQFADWRTNEMQIELSPFPNRSYSAVLTPNKKLLIAESSRVIDLWALHEREKVATIDASKDSGVLSKLEVSANGLVLAAKQWDGDAPEEIWLWNLAPYLKSQ